MRKGRRAITAGLGALLLWGLVSTFADAKGVDPNAGGPVRLTVEIAWSRTAAANDAEAHEVDLEVSEGQIVDAVALPWEGDRHGADEPPPERTAAGAWRLGSKPRGRARVRVEAPVGAGLLLRAGGTPMRFPLPLVLEGPQRTPPQSPVEISVERVPWDVLALDLGPEPGEGRDDGVVAPGARVPASVAFHVLTPEPSEAAVRCVAELRPARGGEPVWRHEIRPTVPTNAQAPPAFILPIDAPKDEGTYVLEVRASWEPAPAHEGGKLINRLIRRGKRGLFGPATASRRVTLAVLGPGDPAKAKDKTAEAASSPGKAAGRETEVDAVDLSRLRGHRDWGTGRSPLSAPGRPSWSLPEEALAAATARERFRGLIGRAGAEVATIGPADGNGLAWSSLGLRAAHPGKPHRLTLKVSGGHPSALGVAVVGPGTGAPSPAAPGSGSTPRLLLDACVSGPPVPAEGPPAVFSWLVWPDTTDPVLVLVNRSSGGPVHVGSVTLTELTDLPAGPAVERAGNAPARALGLYLGGADVIERFGGSLDTGLTDALAAARNLGAYLSACGATSVVLPESLTDRDRRRALDGTAAEDATGPDRLDLALRVLNRRGVSTWLELALDGPLPGLPGPDSPEALAKGLVRVDRQGQADGPVPAYHPLSDEVGAALRQRVADAAAHRAGRAKLAGLLVRMGPGPTLLGSPDTGFDDATFTRFVREALDAGAAAGVPGQSTDDPERFAARAKFLAGPGRMPWLTWRSKRVAALYADLATAARVAAPGIAFAVATPGPDDGPAGAEARRADLAGLAPSLAWRAVGLDLDAWPDGDGAPVVLRGVGLGPDDLTHDLATSPELDAKVAARPARGLLLDLGGDPKLARHAPAGGTGLSLKAAALETGANGDEPFGHALAALDAHHVWLAAEAVAGHEERFRRFARVFLALPAVPTADRQPLAFGVAVRSYPAGENTFLAMANDTPYPVRLDTVLTGDGEPPVFDIGRAVALKPGADAAGRHLVLDLPPFGVSAVRVGSAAVRVGTVIPYPSETVLTALKNRYDDVTAQLTRLNRGGDRSRSGPPNPGFEPEALHETTMRTSAPAADPPGTPPRATAPALSGWSMAGGGMEAGLSLDPSQPHSGRGAMRLDVPTPPASAVSEAFTPAVHSVLLVRTWLRSDRADTRVRLWVEGESAGKPYRRVSEMAVQPGWAERAVRVGDIPPGGLDDVRLRFEVLSPGSLWVDDLTVTGETLSEPERRNARNALLAALQAYREKRFADFARLSGSHWARQPGAGAEGSPERVASECSGLIRSGDASALPPTRRLR